MEEELPNIVQQLVDMGFEKDKSQLAYQKTGNSQELEKVIEYIQDHDEDLDLELAKKMSEEPQQQSQEPQQQQQKQDNQNEEQKQLDEQNLKPVSDMVDQALAQQLIEMGNSKNVAEKALFMTQGKKTIEAALDYIEEHRDDEDFEEQLYVQGDFKQQPKLTPEEARIKAKELQAQLRKKRDQQEEVDEREREKRRREMGKQMNATQQILQEAQKKREVEQQVRERKQFELDKQKMQEQLDRDYIERFGMEKFKKWKASQVGPEVKVKSNIEKTEDCIKAIVTAHPQRVFPEKAMTALKTLKIYTEAIIKSPSEEKFRRINSQNAGFKKRVGDAFSGQATLESIGFVLQEDGFLVLQNPDVAFLQQVVGLLEKHMTTII